MKRCSRCLEEKSLEEFYLKGDGKPYSRCKQCLREVSSLNYSKRMKIAPKSDDKFREWKATAEKDLNLRKLRKEEALSVSARRTLEVKNHEKEMEEFLLAHGPAKPVPDPFPEDVWDDLEYKEILETEGKMERSAYLSNSEWLVRHPKASSN